MGGGIVGIPYAILHTGIPLGIVLMISVAAIGLYTGYLYLHVKDLCPAKVETMYELCYSTMGSASIYIVSLIILFIGIGCVTLYFIVFSSVAVSLVSLAYVDKDSDTIFTDRATYVIALAIVLVPLILKKKLAEMKIISILLFASIGIFIILFLVQLLTLGGIENHDEDYGQYYEVTFDLNLVTGFNIIVLAMGYHTNLFPTYNAFGAKKSNKLGLQAIVVASVLSTLIYITLGILSIYIFGTDLEASVLDNVDQETNVYSYIIRACFLLVLAFHIPYIFFVTKESLLIIYDEAKNRTMATEIETKLQAREQQNSNNRDGESRPSAEIPETPSEPAGYLKLPGWIYYTLTLVLYVGCILTSVFIDDVSLVFDFVGSFGLSLISFMLPGILYLLILRNPKANHQIESSAVRKWNIAGAVLSILLSLLNIALVIVKSVME